MGWSGLGIEAYHESQVEEGYAEFEGPEEACCCCPACDLDLGTYDSGFVLVQVLTCYILLYVIASALTYDKSQDVPHFVFWIIGGKRASLRSGQAVVRETVRSSP